VRTCLRCGEWSPTHARFCAACGAELSGAPVLTERRKVVTVLFADVVGSTALGERVDSETLRWAMQRWFTRMRDVIEAHGGIVEKYIGDAVMAVFGIPVTHEDDALRAVRAAADMREQAGALQDELQRERGVEFGMRIGVNTGEATTGAAPDGGVFTTGDMVNVAARLEQSATPGQILLGRETLLLVEHAVHTDPVAPLVVKGKREPIEAFQLTTVTAGARGRAPRARAPMVGRGPERQRLFEAFDRAVAERRPQLVTVLGAAGIGKSRLVDEVTGALRDAATVAVGRCLPYGDGLTWWPLAEALADHGLDARAAEVLGGGPVAPEDAQLALRTALETLARRRPLVLVVDDLHLAQGPLLDLFEHVADVTTDAPLLLVTTARPELLDARPGWAADRTNASAVWLDALAVADATALLRHLVGPARLGDAAAARILDVADGYPLFLEEVVAMLVDDGVLGPAQADPGDIAIPSTIQSLLTARLDRLSPSERAVIEAAAVEGKQFAAGTVETLLGAAVDGVGVHLSALISKDLVEPGGSDGFRFCHQLIRDAAYEGIAKQQRAALHERFANALVGGTAPEELLGYHLERAVLLRRELGEPEVATATLAARATASLSTAALRAAQRVDPGAAIGLLERAIVLAGTDAGSRAPLLPPLGASLYEAGRMDDAAAVLDSAIRTAADPVLLARARIERELVRLETEASAGTDTARQVAGEARAVLERVGDHRAVSRTWWLEAYIDWIGGRVNDADAAWERAAQHAQRTGDGREHYLALAWRATASVFGPAPVDEAIARCEAFRSAVADSPASIAMMVNPLASLHAMRGDFDLAERYLVEANEILNRLGTLSASVSHHEMFVWRLAGRFDLAEKHLRAGAQRLEAMSDGGLLATTHALLAQVVYPQGRLEEAAELCRAAAGTAASDDVLTQMVWRGVHAKILARSGHAEAAEAMARDAVALGARTDLLWAHGDAMLDLAEVLRLGNRAEEADGATHTALSLLELKGNVAAAAQVRTPSNDRTGRP
jgi:class 3 adenylate cyclase/tetratricopeptide (TPR) repeat protein